MNNINTKIENSLFLVRRYGFQIVPAQGKRPILHDFPNNGSKDETQIREWLTPEDRNFGILVGKDHDLAVLDVDAPEGWQSLQTLNRQLGGILPKTLTVRTGRGGAHFYFRYPKDVDLGNSTSKLAPKLDVKAYRGIVVGPGSIHPDTGKQYVLINPNAPIADFPVQFLPYLLNEQLPPPVEDEKGHFERDFATAELKKQQAKVVNASQGSRNSQLNSSAFALGKLIPKGYLEEDQVIHCLHEAARQAGLSESEILPTIHSGLAKGKSSPKTLKKPNRQTEREEYFQQIAENFMWEPVIPLKNALLPVAPFQIEWMPEAFQPWILDITERMQCEPDYLAVAVVIVLATLVGRQVCIRPKEQDDWYEVPNLWAMLVGRPGVMKSPALSVVLQYLYRCENEAREAFQKEHLAWEVKKETYDAQVQEIKNQIKEAHKKKADTSMLEWQLQDCTLEPEPTLKRKIVSDATPEAIPVIQAENPNGLLVCFDELIELLESLHKQRNESFKGYMLSAWNGKDPKSVDRITRDSLHVKATCLSIIGTIQPDTLRAYYNDSRKGGRREDGFAQRFQLSVFPDVNPVFNNVDRLPHEEAKHQAEAVFQRLACLDLAAIGAIQDTPDDMPYLRYSPDAQAIFTEWRCELESQVRSGKEATYWEAHLSKQRKLIPALSLLFHLADGGQGPIGEEALLRALAYGDYLLTHAKRIFHFCQGEVNASLTLFRHLQEGSLDNPFHFRDIQRAQWSGLRDRESIDAAIQKLIEHHVIQKTIYRTAGKSGFAYFINPMLWEVNNDGLG